MKKRIIKLEAQISRFAHEDDPEEKKKERFLNLVQNLPLFTSLTQDEVELLFDAIEQKEVSFV